MSICHVSLRMTIYEEYFRISMIITEYLGMHSIKIKYKFSLKLEIPVSSSVLN